MTRDTNALIADLADDLQPVTPLRFSSGIGYVLAALDVTVVLVGTLRGFPADLGAGRMDALFLLTTGLYLLLGIASAVAVIAMSRPHVGSDHDGWRWAAAMAALLPLTAGIVALGASAEAARATRLADDIDCLIAGTAWGTISFGMLIWWLRRGAPTSPERAGLVAGLAAGSLGTFAYSLHCPIGDIVHVGLWHGAAVALFALFGRISVPRLVRW